MTKACQTLLAVLAIAGSAASLRAQELLPLSSSEQLEVQPELPQFDHGRPNKLVDAVGWAFGIPKKIILWDRRAENHHVSATTEQELAQYLDANGLESTKVRINEYDPIGEWQRLGANKKVGAGWRYTFGAFGALTYTLIPGRVFGSDGYNPYTDSVYIYSDIPCLAQEQAAYAKLVRSRSHPGSYVAITSLPVVQLWPEKQCKSDVLDYTLANCTVDQQQEATRVLYAEFGAEVGSQASVFLGANLPLTIAGAGIGHAAAHLDRTADSAAQSSADAAELSARTAAQADAPNLRH